MKSGFLTILLTLALASPAGARVLQSKTKVYPVGQAHAFRLDFPVGKLRVEAIDGNAAEITVRIHCRRLNSNCEARARRIHLETTTQGDAMKVRVVGVPKMNSRGLTVQALVRIPRSLTLDVDMGVGQAEIHGMAGDVDVDMGVGELSIELPEESVRSIRMNVGIGEAGLDHPGRRMEGAGFLGHRLKWQEGRGDAEVDVHLGIGEINVALR